MERASYTRRTQAMDFGLLQKKRGITTRGLVGDDRRFEVLAGFVQRNFPPPLKIADAAGGQGNLSFILTQKGYDCTVIDPRKTNLSKKERQISQRKGIQFKRIRSKFHSEMADDYDLVIGLHPDQATEEICRAAQFKPTIIVPCCKYWDGIESHGSASLPDTIRKFFRRNKIEWWETLLKMNGKNLVFVTQPKEE